MPIRDPFPDVRRIVVLRGGGLGDLVMTLPALHALRATYPEASLTLLGTDRHRRLLTGRPGAVTETLELPVARGVYEPPGAIQDAAAVDRFLERLAARRFDLAVQLHGGGRWSNPFLLALRATHSVGARTPDAVAPRRWVPYRYFQHQTVRALEIVGLAGAPPTTLEPVVTTTPADLAAADRALAGLPRPVVAVHPSATDPRRCWPAERFADVAAAVVASGAAVVVLGSAAEREAATAAAASCPAVRILAGELDESALVGVLARSAVLVGNDSGPRHLAAAVGTPTVSVYWVGNLINAGPLVHAAHRVHLSWTTACPVCGALCVGAELGDTYRRCDHDVPFVADVPLTPVRDDVLDLLARV